jgi:Sec-independent protein translocase protein TatA
MKIRELLDDLVSTSSDLAVLLRDLCIVVLVGMLLFAPGRFKSLLTELGVKQVSAMGFDIDVASTATETVSSLDRGLNTSVDAAQKIQATVTDPQAKKDVGDLVEYLKTMQQDAQTTDTKIKTSLVAQAASGDTSVPAAKTGWLFAGMTDKDMQRWTGTTSVVPPNVSPKFTVNEKFITATSAYVRDNFSKGKVIGVVKANTQVQVIAPPQCPVSLGGGHSCWIQVQLQ